MRVAQRRRATAPARCKRTREPFIGTPFGLEIGGSNFSIKSKQQKEKKYVPANYINEGI
jgi:hypothetical protein